MSTDEEVHWPGDGCVPVHNMTMNIASFPIEIAPSSLVQIVSQNPRNMVDANSMPASWYAEELLKRCVPNWSAETDHSADTAQRFVNSLTEMCDRTKEEFTFTTFQATSDEMIVLENIPFYTLCAHHVVPFYGFVNIGYVPRDRIAGLSKFARTMKYVCKGLWVQEELTAAIHDFLDEKLNPKGLAVNVRGEHMCMSMRGVQLPGVFTTTNKMSGVFGDHTKTAKAEFWATVGRSK